MTWKVLRIGLPAIALIAVAGLLAVRVGIVHGIDAASDKALAAYPGSPDRVSALMSFVNDPEQSLADRDRAVWALGQMRDSRALPVLWIHAKDEECRHGDQLCRYELAKAIALCEDPGPDLLRIATR